MDSLAVGQLGALAVVPQALSNQLSTAKSWRQTKSLKIISIEEMVVNPLGSGALSVWSRKYIVPLATSRLNSRPARGE
jgi:hypothetical protein